MPFATIAKEFKNIIAAEKIKYQKHIYIFKFI